MQAEQLKILEAQHQKQIEDFNHIHPTPHQPDIAVQYDQLVTMQKGQNIQLQENFNQQLQNLQQQQQLNNTVNTQGQIQKLSDSAHAKQANGAVIIDKTKVNVREEKGKLSLLSSGASLDKFVNALNQLGVSVKDMGVILMAIKKANALYADIIMS